MRYAKARADDPDRLAAVAGQWRESESKRVIVDATGMEDLFSLPDLFFRTRQAVAELRHGLSVAVLVRVARSESAQFPLEQ